MKIFAAACGAALISAAALSGPVAHANPSSTVHASYGCNSVTFTNHAPQTALVHYTTANSDDPGYTIRIPSQQTRTVKVTAPHIAKRFGWAAKTVDGEPASDDHFDGGFDLTKNCSKGSGSGGLAKTGV